MNLGFEKIKVYYDGQPDNKHEGKIMIEPLERGYARTLGNVLENIMLTSVEGTAVVGVQFPSITSVYSSLPGTVNDMVELILNLRQLRFHTEALGVQKVIFEATEQGVYKADALQLPHGVTLYDDQVELMELTGEQKVMFAVYIQKGKGYVDATLHPSIGEEKDVIPVDSRFSPVLETVCKVESVRIGQNANFERLVLDVKTDGTLTPKEVITIASRLASGHYNYCDQSEWATGIEIFQEKKVEEDKILDYPLEFLDLSKRAQNCLRRDGFVTVRKIYTLTEKGLYAINQMGDTTVKEVIAKMKELGLELQKE